MNSYIVVHPSGMDPFLSRLPPQFHDGRECWGDDRDLAIRFSDKREAEQRAELEAKKFGDGVVRVDTVEHPEIEGAFISCYVGTGTMEGLPALEEYYRKYGMVSLKYFAERALFGAPGDRRMMSGCFATLFRNWCQAPSPR